MAFRPGMHGRAHAHTQTQTRTLNLPAPALASALGTRLGSRHLAKSARAPCVAHWLKFLHGVAGWGEEGGVGGGGRRRLLEVRTSSVLNFPLLTRPGIPLERPSGAGSGAGSGVGKLAGAGRGRRGTRARQEEGAGVPAAGRALREVSASSCDFTY